MAARTRPARSGITHLIEHLALHSLGLVDYHFNGNTGPIITTFHMQGSAEDVARFISQVCLALHNLPLDRMETEKEILRTEADGNRPHVTEPLAVWRYGARSYGLVGYPEWGLAMLTPDDLRAWAAHYFTRDNAVLWIAGDGVPDGLSLNLPAGARRPAPAASSALPTTPAYFAGSSHVVALDAVVERSTAAAVFAAVLERELFRALRQESGLSYTAGANYEPRDGRHAVITALADALPEKQDAVLGGFIDVLAKLRVGRIEQADVDAVVAKRLDALNFAEAHAASLPAHAFNLLTGHRNLTFDEARAELKAVTVDQVREIAVQALDTALLMVPEDRRADWAGFVAAPSVSDSVVAGQPYPSLSDDEVRLVVGAEGVSLVGRTDAITVRYDQCSAMLAWPDGGRLLIGHDAINVRVEPTLHRGLAAAIPAIDAAVPAQLRVDMPARDPSAIPQPQPRQQPGTVSRARRVWVMAKVAILALVVAVLGGFSLLLTLGLLIDPEGAAEVWWVAAGGLALTAYFSFAMWRNARELRQ